MVAEPTSSEKFSERARKVLQLAEEEARRFNHSYIGTEHILLGLIRETEGIGAKVIANLGVELGKVRSAVEFIVGRGERPSPAEISMTPRTKRVIELAFDEAHRLNHHYVGTEHLLIGIMREDANVASGVLESHGVTLDRLRAETGRVLWASSVPASGESPVSDEEIAQILERVAQSLDDLEKARTLLLRLQAERTAQKPQEPSAQT